MNPEILLPLFFALLSPLLWATTDIVAEFVTDNKTKNALSFAFVAGSINTLFGLILACFLSWQGAHWQNYLPPAVSGVFLGLQFFLYFWMLKKEDVSNVIGFSYFYPIIVYILSFLFLREVLTFPIYLSMGLIMVGVALLSARVIQTKLRVAVWMIASYALIVALYEFFIKVTTNNVSEFNGLAVSSIFLGLVILPAVLFKKVRSDLKYELKNNFGWALITEALTLLAVFTTYLAMSNLPATIVSSLQATQPLLVLFLEKIGNQLGFLKSFDLKFRRKFLAIMFIAIGASLMAFAEVLGG